MLGKDVNGESMGLEYVYKERETYAVRTLICDRTDMYIQSAEFRKFP